MDKGVVSFPAPNHHTGKGLVTLEQSFDSTCSHQGQCNYHMQKFWKGINQGLHGCTPRQHGMPFSM